MLFWTLAIIAFIIIEAATTQFVSIWFAGGSLAALIGAMSGLALTAQIIIFVSVSAILLLFTNKFVNRFKSRAGLKTNFSALIGQTGVVIEDISNADEKGVVRLRGIEWSARSENGKNIAQGTHVTVKKIDGVKLIVNILEENL